MKIDKHKNQVLPLFALLLAALLFSDNVLAERDEYADLNAPPRGTAKSGSYADKSSWAFAFDNDVLVPGSRDQDYTYGFNITFAGRKAQRHYASLHETLDRLNRALELDGFLDGGVLASKIEYGLFGFTPEDITLSMANPDDRPYASLLYVSSTRESYHVARDVSWQSTLTVGLLGLDLVGELQNQVHSAYGGNDARGWDNQISQGGEPTARYSLARQQLLHRGDRGLEFKSTLQGSVGYITEVGWSLGMRLGKIRSPWIAFNPELTSYAEKSIPDSIGAVAERYFWAGFALKYRAYNAFLEGQFRDSEVTYDDDEINRAIVEAWVGYTVAFNNGYSLTYSIRGHSSEINRGDGDRNVVWGGILLAKRIG